MGKRAVFPQNVQGDVVTLVTPGGYVLEIGDYVAVFCADGGADSTFVTR